MHNIQNKIIQMKNIKKYEGIIPALYACYDESGAVSIERTKALTQWFIDQGVNGRFLVDMSYELTKK